jgi:hypothetical protein
VSSPFELAGNQIKCSIQLTKEQLQLKIKYQNPLTSSGFLTTNNNIKYLSLSLLSDLNQATRSRTEYFLVIDCSGSMSGSNIIMARETLTLFIRSLPDDCLFNIIRFGKTFELMFESTQQYDRTSYQHALSVTSILKADLGGTDVLSPLNYIFETPTKQGYVRQIFLITDGQVEQQTSCIALATRNRKNHRIFTVGIGHSVSAEFIKEISECTQSSYTFVQKGSDILSAVMEQFLYSLAPAVSNLQIFIEGYENFEISPFPLPTLFNNILTHVFIRFPLGIHFDNPPTVLVTGLVGDYVHEITLTTIVPNESIKIDSSKVFAYFNIRDLENKIALAPIEKLSDLKKRTIQASHENGLVSQFTRWQISMNGKPVTQEQLTVMQNDDIEFAQMQPNFDWRSTNTQTRSTENPVCSQESNKRHIPPKKLSLDCTESQTGSTEISIQKYSMRQTRNSENYISQTQGKSYHQTVSESQRWGESQLSDHQTVSKPQRQRGSQHSDRQTVSRHQGWVESQLSDHQTVSKSQRQRGSQHSDRQTVSRHQGQGGNQQSNQSESLRQQKSNINSSSTTMNKQKSLITSDPLIKLIDLQDFDGFWSQLETILTLFHLTEFDPDLPSELNDFENQKKNSFNMSFFENFENSIQTKRVCLENNFRKRVSLVESKLFRNLLD